MIHALHVRKFAQAKGKLAKTDALDATILDDYGLKMQPPIFKKKCTFSESLRVWTHRRMQLVNLMRLEKQALENQEHQEMIDLIKANMSAFKKQIKQIDQKIQDVIQQKEDLR